MVKRYSTTLLYCFLVVAFGTTLSAQAGAALDFNGGGDYAVLPFNATLDVSQFTIETWVKRERTTGSIDFLCGGGSGQMEIQIGNGTDNSTIRFIPVLGVVLDAPTNSIPQSTWTHLACVYNPSAGLAKMYVNGVEVTLTNNGGSPLTTPLVLNAGNMIIGNRSIFDFPFKGQLDEFRLWNRALTQAEIQAKMSCEIPTSATGLVINLHFNQGIAAGNNTALTTLTDASGNNNNFTLTNFTLTGSTSNWVGTGGIPIGASCNRFFVNGAVATSGNGQTWATAFKTIQEGIDAAGAKEVWVAAGLYQPVASVNMKNGVALYGGFVGTETQLSQRNWKTNVTTIDGVNNGQKSVISNTNLNNTAVLDGFKIQGGNANGGGGMLNEQASPTITHCTFYSNSARLYGGAMYNGSSSPIISYCVFEWNSTLGVGGGIYSGGGSPFILNCVFTFNSSKYEGAAIYNYGSSPTLFNCTIGKNTAENYRGAGMFNNDASPIITNCIFWGDYYSEIINTGASAPNVTYSAVQGGYGGTGNTNLYPLFLNPDSPMGADGVYGTADDGWRLTCGSPAYNTGTNTGAAAYDLLGVNRPQFGTADMGAYESITDLSLPTATITGVTTACDAVTLTASGGVTYTWSGGSTPSVATNTFTTSGTYTVTVTSASGCTTTATQTVTVNKTPIITLTGVPVACNGGNVTLTASGGDTYAWSGGTTPSVATNTFTTSGTYTVTVTNACYSATLSQPVTILSAGATKLYVNGAVATSGDGTSWATAVKTLQEVLGASSSLSCIPEIWVAKGTYSPTDALILKNNIAIYGGFAGTETTLSQRNWTTNVTTISGSNNGNKSIFSNNGINNTAVLDGFTLTGSNTTNGGGMKNVNASPTISHCVFISNTASSTGGGIYNDASSPIISGCTFANNTSGNGAGIFNINAASPTVTNCVFTGNTGTISAGMSNNYASNPTIINCTFSGNSVTVGSCAMGNNEASPIITNCILWGNIPDQISNYLSTPSVTYCAIQGGYTGTGNINQNPSFFNANNPAGADGIFGTSDDGYRLLCSSSPCMDAGTNTGAPTTDILGSAIAGSTKDIGAYESGTTTVTLTMTSTSPTVGNNGTATATPSSGSGFSYVWNNGQATQTATGLAGGTYTVTAINNNACGSGSVFVTANGAALDFDGVNDHLQVAHNATLNISQFTIETWLKWGSSGTNVQFVCSKGGIMEIHTGGGSSNNIRFIPLDGIYVDGGAHTIMPNTWVHLACVYNPNGNNGAGLAKMYVNGNEVAVTITGGAPLNTPMSTNTAPLIIGARSSSNYPFLGQLDEFRLWNVALTHAEIQARMSCEIPTSACGLVINAHCNQGITATDNTAITTLTDASGNNNNGTLTNMTLNGATSNFVGIGGVISGTSCAAPLTITITAGAATNPSDCYPTGGSIAFTSSNLPSGVYSLSYTKDGSSNTASVTVTNNAFVLNNLSAGVYTSFSISTIDCGATDNTTKTLTNLVITSTVYVNSAVTTSGDGLSWATAMKTLQEALVLSNPCINQIWVAKGTYSPTASLRMKNNLAIYGGFAGTETILNQRNWTTNVTTISGSNNGNKSIFSNNGINNTAVLDGFTLTGSNTTNGGGMKNVNASPTISHCVFKGNTASSTGGGIYNDACSPIISGCTFANNTSGNGAGIFNITNASPTVTNCVFTGNTGTISAGMSNNYASNPTITNCTFSGNSVTANGSAIGNSEATPVIKNCILWGNVPDQMFNSASTPSVTYCDIQGGYAGTGNIDQNPLFFNANNTAGADGVFGTSDDGYRLGCTSPCKDAGTNTGAPTTDILGNATEDSTKDMGAFESGAAITLTMTSTSATTGNNGTATATPSSGSGFTYLWNNGQTTQTATGLVGGTYTVTVEKSNACGTGSVFVTANGAALDFDGVNDNVQIDHNATLDMSQFTIETWLKWGSSGTNVQFLCSKGGIMEIHTGGSSNNIRFIPLDGIYVDGGINTITPNTWVHLACVYNPNGNNGAGLVKMYVNGNEVAVTITGGAPLNTPMPTNTVPLIIGARSGFVLPFLGQLDEFRLWNFALTQAEIQARMSCEIPTSACGLVFNAHFNQGITAANNTAITTLTDASGNNNNGTFTNMTLNGATSNFVGIGGVLSGTSCAAPPTITITADAPTNPSDCYPTGGNIAFTSSNLPNGVYTLAYTKDGSSNTASITVTNNAFVLNNLSAGVYTSFSINTINCGATDNTTKTLTNLVIPPTVYVNSAVTTSGDGLSWATAVKTLQEALVLANSPCIKQIWVAKGTYSPTASMSMRNNLAIYGGFIGTETTLNQRNWTTNVTTISGSSNGNQSIFSNNSINNTAVLDGFTITAGNAADGGGMNNDHASPTIRHCIFLSNTASGTGGGIYNTYASPIISGCSFVNNSSGNGAGIFNINAASPTVTNCVFTGNTGVISAGVSNNYASNPTIINCTFSGNTTTGGSCAIGNNEASPTITNCIFWGNIPDQISNYLSTPSVTYSDVQGGYTGTGNIDKDPLFVNANSPVGLQLQSTSPAIDAGTNIDAPTTDILGNGISNGSRDIGAYEFQQDVVYAGTSACQSVTIVNVTGNQWFYFQHANGLIAAINPNGMNLGTVTASISDPTDALSFTGSKFLGRVVNFTSSNYADGVTMPNNYTLKIYYKNAELTEYNTLTGGSSNRADFNMIWQQGASGCTLSSALSVGVISKNTLVTGDFGTSNNGFYIQFPLNHFTVFAPSTSSNSVLPIEFLDFSGYTEGDANHLTWATTNEVNNKGFQIERIMNKGQWIILGYVKAKGMAGAYEYFDNQPLTTSYYRLRQIDNDGKEAFSKIISIERKGNNNLKVYPNPVSDVLNIEYSEEEDFQIINLLGQTVISGKTVRKIDVSTLPQGNYFLKLGMKQVKFVKQ